MTKEALKLALEALETPWNAPYVDGCDLALGKRVKAITAIKEALANEALEKMAENARELGLDYEPAQSVAWAKFSAKGNIVDLLSEPDDDYTPLYTTPPQRTWVGLTDEELQPIADEYRILFGSWVEDFARAIEAKLRSKNESKN